MEKKMNREEASRKIHDIADKIGEGKVDLKSGEDSVELRPANQVEFEVEVEEEKDGDTSIEIEVEWAKDDKGDDLEIN